jgi:hypothetical protein
MNIQISQTFAMSPVSERPVDTSSKKRPADETPHDEPPAKKCWMDQDEIKQAMEVLAKRYQLDENQRIHLRTQAERVNWVPSVAEVEWVATEARLREGSSHDFHIWMFPYMEYYQWFLRTYDGDSRLWLGQFIRSCGATTELWIGFNARPSGPKAQLYYPGSQPNPLGLKNRLKHFFKHPHWVRRWLTWCKPFDYLFQLRSMTPQDYHDGPKNKRAAVLQNEYLKAVMKVLARFPGLIVERDAKENNFQLYKESNPWPFRHQEKFSENSPLAKLFETLCTKKAS